MATQWLNPWFFATQIQIQIQIPTKYLRFGYTGLVFCRNIGTKIGTDKLTESTPNAPKLSTQAQKFGISMKKDFIGRP